MELDLDAQVRRLLQTKRGDWPRIAQETEVSYSWLCKFAAGRIPNPGFNRLRRLSSYLGEAAHELAKGEVA